MPEQKNLVIEVKADGDKGSFTGVLSTYGNVDQAGDVCLKGCFTKDVATYGTKRPLLWQHDAHQPIGSFEIVDTEQALVIAGKYNLDVEKGREAYALTRAGDIGGLSIGYRTEQADYDAEGHRLLKEVTLYEGSVVTFPCNREAVLTAVKEREDMAEEDHFKQIEERLKACEDALAKLAAKEEAEDEDKGKKQEEPEDETDTETDDEEEQKAFLAAIEHLNTTIKN